MSWLIVKKVLKESWIWLKEHWQLPFLFVWTIVVYVLTRRNTDSLIEVVEAKKESYRRQVEALRKSHNDELLRRDSLEDKYEKVLEEVERKFESEEKRISEENKNKIKEVIVKSKGNSDEIRKRIEEEFGFRFVE